MSSPTDIFFKFLRFAISTSHSLPSMTFADLEVIYEIAQRQSLTGIVYHALEKSDIRPIDIDCRQEDFEDLLMQWMGDKMKIVRQNEKLNQDVRGVTEWFRNNGFESCLLKGQGNAILYPISTLRTAGDIDLWVRPQHRTSLNYDINGIIAFVNANTPRKCRAIYHHVDGLEWNGTEVEVHYRPHFMQNFIYNARLQYFFNQHADEQFKRKVIIGRHYLAAPTPAFNIVFQISHIYQHLFNEGIGLRQILDYYYVLKSYADEKKNDATNWNMLLDYLGLLNIAGAIMWILEEKFGMTRDWAIVSADEKRGRFVLNEILQGGNFGKYDLRNARFGHSRFGRNIQRLVRDIRLVRYFPSEALSEPFFRLWHAWWRFKYN